MQSRASARLCNSQQQCSEEPMMHVLGRETVCNGSPKCNQLQPSRIFEACKLLKNGGQGRNRSLAPR